MLICSMTRTGSSELSTLTVGVRWMRLVRAAIAASSTTGEETAKSRRWCSPTPKTDSPAWSATSACSISSCRRRCAVTTRPVSGSGVSSPK